MTAKFDLTFTIEEKDNQLILNIEYAKDLFNPETIKQVSNHYVQLLNKVIDEHSVSISQLNIITEKEKQQLLSEFNNTDLAYPFEKTIHEIFEEQAQRPLNK
ncbi:Carrier domain-containing protein OS=Lysinibacillus sphaericus OX=1421 GN=LS41612_16115 PE=3 SV=1 [Lysinibacillus sphaericus]